MTLTVNLVLKVAKFVIPKINVMFVLLDIPETITSNVFKVV